jgi:hypothetical protein
MGLTTSGSVPLALPGGEAQAVKKPAPAPDALLMRTPAKGEIAFPSHKKGIKTPAFWKEKKAFGKDGKK